MANLECDLAGIPSPNPFWLASGPPANTEEQVSRAFEAGWGGAVWKTLCPEPVINVSSRLGALPSPHGQPAALNNIELIMDRPLAENLREIASLKKRFPDRAIVASVMAGPKKEWRDLIQAVEDAGADGLELNFGCPHGMCERGLGSAVGQEPKILSEILGWVRGMTTLPLIVKLTPNVTDITEPGLAAARGGADALSLINTVKSIIGVDLDRLTPLPRVGSKGTSGGMCGPAVKPIALHMVAELARHPGIPLPLSAVGGIGSWRDAAEFLLLGAANVQVCTAVMLHGVGIVQEMVEGLSAYMDEKGFPDLAALRGRALPNTVAWGDLDLNYRVVASIDPKTCTACHLCVVACRDGGHQCIRLPDAEGEPPRVDVETCVGCNLCAIVCPVPACIVMKEVETGRSPQSWNEFQAEGRRR
ncbi:MAG: NAD-dependent dihydropyrimidine dehydrogenase subunit PreA [Planctomycetota bacterium]|jgi:dihydropyrimidine dehydrogenase (NAD+) subunit PreA